MYTTAHDSLESLDPKIFGHWKLYFGLKSKFYLAYVSTCNLPQMQKDTVYDGNFYYIIILNTLKMNCYLQAFNYKGEALLNQDECGAGIRSLQESQKCM